MVCTHVTSCFDETKGNICMKTELMASPQGIANNSSLRSTNMATMTSRANDLFHVLKKKNE